MARFCVHLDEAQFEVEVDGDETDAIRVAREQNNISEVRHPRAHRLPDVPAEDAPAADVASDSAPAAEGDGAAPPALTRAQKRAAAKSAKAAKAEAQ